MIGLALIALAALAGYRIALKEIEAQERFNELPAAFRAKIIALGMICSMVIVFSFLVWSGALN